jgi:hypothetical protein
VLAAAGCRAAPSQSAAPEAQRAGEFGLVAGLLGTPLSASPGGSAVAAAASDLALLAGMQQVAGVIWRRVIVADGTEGWTSRDVGAVRSVRVQPSMRPLSLVSKSPDDPGFSEAEEILIDDGVDGMIVGISRGTRVAGNEQLMLPERYRHTLPWLELRFGSQQGFAPLDWIAFRAAPAARPLPEALDGLGAKGLVWRPFLGDVASATIAGGIDGRAYALADPVASPRRAQTSGEWSSLEFTFRDERGAMAVYGDGPRRMFRFVENGAAPVDIVLGSDWARPAQVRHRDLNGDGTLEWLVEIAARYGDGFYAALWILDGRPPGDALALERLLLSHSAGEPASSSVDGTWQLRDDGTIEVTRRTNGDSRTTTYRYRDTLTEVRSPAARE